MTIDNIKAESGSLIGGENDNNIYIANTNVDNILGGSIGLIKLRSKNSV